VAFLLNSRRSALVSGRGRGGEKGKRRGGERAAVPPQASPGGEKGARGGGGIFPFLKRGGEPSIWERKRREKKGEKEREGIHQTVLGCLVPARRSTWESGRGGKKKGMKRRRGGRLPSLPSYYIIKRGEKTERRGKKKKGEGGEKFSSYKNTFPYKVEEPLIHLSTCLLRKKRKGRGKEESWPLFLPSHTFEKKKRGDEKEEKDGEKKERGGEPPRKVWRTPANSERAKSGRKNTSTRLLAYLRPGKRRKKKKGGGGRRRG